MVKHTKRQGCRIFYTRRPEFETADEKLTFLNSKKIGDLPFEELQPDLKNDWVNQVTNDFEKLLPLATKGTKTAERRVAERAIFKLFSLGAASNRDDWAYDYDPAVLAMKIEFFCAAYQSESQRWREGGRPAATGDFVARSIKWTSELEAHMRRGTVLAFSPNGIVPSLYRPFVQKSAYFAPIVMHRPYRNFDFFPDQGSQNIGICFSVGKRTDFAVIATNRLPNLDVFIPSAVQTVCQWRYSKNEGRQDNITDWALVQFKRNYQPGRGRKSRPITKEAIFRYVYGVLHDPVYRDKYAQNLKSEFPHIPFYADFWQWAEWGQILMDLHIGYETAESWPLRRSDVPDKNARKAGLMPKAILKADKEAGGITLDTETALANVPPEAWEYRLGNRSALEWVLDQYKEKTPKDPTIRAQFATYRFADYKEKVIDLLARVTTVSVETVRITRDMYDAER